MTYSIQTASQRGAYKRSIVLSIFLAAIVAMLPGQVLAQGLNCPININVDFQGSSGPFELNEDIPMQVSFEAGFSPVPVEVQIDTFKYLLDCDGLDFDQCQATPPVGNSVELVESSVSTNCTIDGVEPAVLVTVLQNSVTVEFLVEDAVGDPASIVLDSTAVPLDVNTCDVFFDVRVTALGGIDAESQIVEWTGFGATDTRCVFEDGTISGSADSDSISFSIVNPNAVFWVTKDFTDDNKSEVDVHLRCSTGTVLNGDFSITDPAANGIFPTVGFIVYGIPSIGANCRVFEDPIPSGYSQSYEASARAAVQGVDYDELGELDDDEGCFYTAVNGGEYDCEITNRGEPAMFTVNKEWVVGNTGGDFVNEEAVVTIRCNNRIRPNAPVPEPGDGIVAGTLLNPFTKIGSLGDGESLVALVDTTTKDAVCFAVEKINQSGVESVDDCQKQRTIEPGGKSECTFVNTVFFEGIPTLNQYGMALMALMMLGLGMIGFRRFG